MRYSTKKHPTLGVYIRNDGAILRKRRGNVRAYWREQKRQWRNSNMEHYREYQKVYRANHKETA